MSTICPGYIGIAKIGGTSIRCTDFSMQVNQDALFYDHIIGLNDTLSKGKETKGEEVGEIQTQKRIWRPSTIGFTGGISFPATPKFTQEFFNYARDGTYFDLDFKYYAGLARRFIGCRLNSWQLTVTAGDIVNITADIWALGMEDTSSTDRYTDSEKIITSDAVSVIPKIDVTEEDIQTFELSIENNLQYIYTADPGTDQPNKFVPRDLRVGMQLVTGSLGLYFDDGRSFLLPDTDKATIELSIKDTLRTNINVVYMPKQRSGAVGPVITEVPFVGVDKAFNP